MSAAAVVVDSYRQQPPLRKPLAQPLSSVAAAPRMSIVPDHTLPYSGHNRSRTASSSIFPTGGSSTGSTPPPATMNFSTRRTLSNATTSTSSTSSTHAPHHSGLQRAPSTASSTNTATPSSYVALMRKQKATVWCERSQFEDPRLLAAQRAAKLRATIEVVGGKSSSSAAAAVAAAGDDLRHLKPGTRTSTASGTMGGVRSKIRHNHHHHHHVPRSNLAPGNLAGSGVPMRLSASEVGDDGDDDASSAHRHNPYGAGAARSGSPRSSLGSSRRVSGFTGAYVPAPGRHSGALGGGGPRNSTGSGLSSAQSSSPDEPPSAGSGVADDTPMPDAFGRQRPRDYFEGAGAAGGDTGSVSSGEREDSFGNLGTMKEMPRPERETADDLRRRGSVDERTSTMTGQVRLFVANPDLSD